MYRYLTVTTTTAVNIDNDILQNLKLFIYICERPVIRCCM